MHIRSFLLLVLLALPAVMLAGCASKAPELLYADGSNRIPVRADTVPPSGQ